MLEPRILIEDPAKSHHAAFRVGDKDLFDNRLIFGDNLLALKALEQEFAGKIKCVYIDPPFNTGEMFEHYDDGLEHSLWLTQMRDRLEILHGSWRETALLYYAKDKAQWKPNRVFQPTERKSLKAQSKYRCACCGTRFNPDALVIDHPIRLSLLVADEPANWVVMSKKHNATKWDRLLWGDLKFYREETVRQRFGVRFIDGAFWPVANGKVRYSRSAA